MDDVYYNMGNIYNCTIVCTYRQNVIVNRTMWSGMECISRSQNSETIPMYFHRGDAYHYLSIIV